MGSAVVAHSFIGLCVFYQNITALLENRGGPSKERIPKRALRHPRNAEPFLSVAWPRSGINTLIR
jgi:hypothetical protein